MLRLPETPVNWAALQLLREWEKQDKELKYKMQRLRPLFRMLAGALRMEAVEEVDTEQLDIPLEGNDGATT